MWRVVEVCGGVVVIDGICWEARLFLGCWVSMKGETREFTIFMRLNEDLWNVYEHLDS